MNEFFETAVPTMTARPGDPVSPSATCIHSRGVNHAEVFCVLGESLKNRSGCNYPGKCDDKSIYDMVVGQCQ